MSSRILNLDANLCLAWPEDISGSYDLNELDRLKLVRLINLFKASIDSSLKEEAAIKLDQAYSILGSPKTFSTQKYLTVAGPLKKEEVEEYDFYFDIKREQTQSSSVFLVIKSILMAYKTFLNLRCFNQDNDALLMWKRYHWIFFVFLQGNILCMLHLRREMRKENMVQVGVILKLMSQLMLASGASMIFAGVSGAQEYADEIRPTMMPPNVKSPDFSGLMSYDHSYLMSLWNKDKKLFKLMPSFLDSAYEEFVDGHKFLALAHQFVCNKYGGYEAGSLREKKITALASLEEFNNARRKLIVKSDCQLLNSDSKLQLRHEFEYEEYIKNGFKCYVRLLAKSIGIA
jgi:hypothetical protein